MYPSGDAKVPCRFVRSGVSVSHLCVSTLIHAGTMWNLSWCHSVDFFLICIFFVQARGILALSITKRCKSLSFSLSQSSAVVQPLREGQTAGAELFGLSSVHTHTICRHTTYLHTSYAHTWTLYGISPLLQVNTNIYATHTRVQSHTNVTHPLAVNGPYCCVALAV